MSDLYGMEVKLMKWYRVGVKEHWNHGRAFPVTCGFCALLSLVLMVHGSIIERITK